MMTSLEGEASMNGLEVVDNLKSHMDEGNGPGSSKPYTPNPTPKLGGAAPGP